MLLSTPWFALFIFFIISFRNEEGTIVMRAIGRASVNGSLVSETPILL